MRKAIYWVLYGFGAPGLMLALIIFLLLFAVRLGTFPKPDRFGIFWSDKRVQTLVAFRKFLKRVPLLGKLVKRDRPWGGHTLGGAGIWKLPTASERLKRHELQHVFQLWDMYLGLGLLALLLRGLQAWTGIGVSWEAAGLLWASGTLVWLASFLASWLRGERLYHDATIEKAAYSITNVIENKHVGSTWEDILHVRRQR